MSKYTNKINFIIGVSADKSTQTLIFATGSHATIIKRVVEDSGK